MGMICFVLSQEEAERVKHLKGLRLEKVGSKYLCVPTTAIGHMVLVEIVKERRRNKQKN